MCSICGLTNVIVAPSPGPPPVGSSTYVTAGIASTMLRYRRSASWSRRSASFRAVTSIMKPWKCDTDPSSAVTGEEVSWTQTQ